jgi:hypothetical protein
MRRPNTRFAIYDLAPGVVRIDRQTPWGNPFVIGAPGPDGHRLDRDEVIALYRRYAQAKIEADPEWLEPLRGKTLACWCRPSEGFKGRLLCHGQVILGLLDGVPPATVE